ncbi:MAG: nucleotidyltransferase family protein [Gammaproteobacteria bacterium]|nr:nucleotidyltransferase family protein [Gammaproteobacteria bacterium]
MKAMILAAGRGERMRPLTDHTPKPLLPVAGKPLIIHTINRLVGAGFSDLVINHAHLGHQIEESIGNGNQFGASIRYSPEGEALETAGGIINALPLLGNAPFLVINGDIATDFPFAELKPINVRLAHIVLINNPVHNPNGDFGLDSAGLVTNETENRYTFSGIGVYHPDLFKGVPPGKSKLAPLLRQGINNQKVSGQLYSGFWMDIGTPERLEELDHRLRQNS